MKSLIVTAVVGLCAVHGRGFGHFGGVIVQRRSQCRGNLWSARRGRRRRGNRLAAGARPGQPRRSVHLRHFALPPCVLQLATPGSGQALKR